MRYKHYLLKVAIAIFIFLFAAIIKNNFFKDDGFSQTNKIPYVISKESNSAQTPDYMKQTEAQQQTDEQVLGQMLFTESSKANLVEAFICAELNAEKMLTDDGFSHFDFDPNIIQHTTALGNYKYQVSSFVETKNSDGQTIRVNFFCDASYDPLLQSCLETTTCKIL